MEPYVVIIFFAVLIVAAVTMSLRKSRTGNKIAGADQKRKIAGAMSTVIHGGLAEYGGQDSAVRFEYLPALSETEEMTLSEIKDQELLARIINAVPGALQVISNSGAVHQYREAARTAGQLYQVILPQGAVLASSRTMEDAFRGFYHGAGGIAGHANLVKADSNLGHGLARVNVANTVMGIAAMVVSQYYMKNINDQLNKINSELSKISSFQDKEYQSRIYALIAEIQKSSQFQLEIVGNDELRKRELDYLKELEHECAQLLGQASLTLKDFEKKKNLDFSNYEKMVAEAQTWYRHQQVLLPLMVKIAELTYTLNLGRISKENCYSVFLPYKKQAEEALDALEAWHRRTGIDLQIYPDANRRRRKGIEGFFMGIPAMFNDDLRYKSVSERTIFMISSQSGGQQTTEQKDGADLFREDVRLIAKDGKLYYLPEAGVNDIHSPE